MSLALRRWPALLALFPALALLCCANRGAPPGGPPDTTPPHVEEIYPSGGSVGVVSDSHIGITFSEPMNKRTVETGVIVSPPCRWRERHWQGQTYLMEPQEGLRPDVTYLVSVSNKVKDAHGVEMTSTFVSGFSTGDSLNAGLMSGSIKWKTVLVEGAVVFLFDAGDLDSLAAFVSAEPLYVTVSGSKGKYEIPFVDTEKRYGVFAIIDDNLNSEYDDGEKVGCYPGDVVFEGTSEIEGVDLTICGETLCGGIVGSIDSASVADTLALAITVRSLDDSSVVYSVKPDKNGLFEIRCVEPGGYSVRVFRDINLNLKVDPEDSIVVELPDTIRVDSCTEPPVVEIKFDDES
jgi:hypothetical protein